MNNEKKFIKLTPFKMQVLQSFPFIDEDFDAITNYELLCKVVDYLNKTVDNVDLLNEKVEEFQHYFDNLDVQEEINNKLDEMAEDGTLTNLIGDYCQPLINVQNQRIDAQDRQIEAQNQEIDTFKSSTNDTLNSLQSQITSIASGSPLVASSISEMTDTTKTYVLTTDGYWYYYDGTDWVRGGIYQSSGIGYLEIKENNIDNKNITPYKIIDSVISPNVYNKNLDTDGGYINSSGGITQGANNIYSDFIYCNNKSNIYLSVVRYLTLGISITLAQYNENFEFITRSTINYNSMTYDETNDIYYLNVILNENCKYIRFSFFYSSSYDKYIQKIMINLENRNQTYVDYYWYINNKTHQQLEELLNQVPIYNQSTYKLHYIKNKKVTCNEVNENRTAVYSGVDLGETVNRMECKYIWENKENVSYSGTLALIINPNGANKITDITDLSLHITFRNYGFTCDVFGKRYNPSENRYQNIMQITYDNPQTMDGVTEHTIQIIVSQSTNTVYITVDGVEYSGTFVPDTNITSLSNVIGEYVMFEHYTDVALANANMPLITKFKVQNVDQETLLLDYFDREDGQLNVSPQGYSYHMFNNGIYNLESN